MTVDTNVANMNSDAVLGFVGGIDSPVINDFLLGYIEGAQYANPDIKIDTRYTGNYIDTAIAKEYALSMIDDNKCDIIWGAVSYTHLDVYKRQSVYSAVYQNACKKPSSWKMVM